MLRNTVNVGKWEDRKTKITMIFMYYMFEVYSTLDFDFLDLPKVKNRKNTF